MTEQQITTAAELDALPEGSVVRTAGVPDECSPTVWERRWDAYWYQPGDEGAAATDELDDLPATVLYRPDAPTARDQAAPTEDREALAEVSHSAFCNDGLSFQDGPPYECRGECAARRQPTPTVTRLVDDLLAMTDRWIDANKRSGQPLFFTLASEVRQILSAELKQRDAILAGLADRPRGPHDAIAIAAGRQPAPTVSGEQVWQAITGRNEPWGGCDRREEVERVLNLLDRDALGVQP